MNLQEKYPIPKWHRHTKLGMNMNNVIAFLKRNSRSRNARPGTFRNNVLDLTEWRKAPHPIRTPNGVFFVSNVLVTPGDSA